MSRSFSTIAEELLQAHINEDRETHDRLYEEAYRDTADKLNALGEDPEEEGYRKVWPTMFLDEADVAAVRRALPAVLRVITTLEHMTRTSMDFGALDLASDFAEDTRRAAIAYGLLQTIVACGTSLRGEAVKVDEQGRAFGEAMLRKILEKGDHPHVC